MIDKKRDAPFFSSGSIEPHGYLLELPPDGQPLYKIMTVENLIRSIEGGYLYFSRVDNYKDFPGADPNDGQQLLKDRQGNARTCFAEAPNFTAADYYDQSRARTYACCLSLENTNFIWNNYANDSEKGKICVVFDFGKLRSKLNNSFQTLSLKYKDCQCRQIFSIDYGIIKYIEWDRHQGNETYLPNPIKYTYLKDKEKFGQEKELRISLSALGTGKFALNGSIMQFPSSIQMPFDFKDAIADGTVEQVLYSPDCDLTFLQCQLLKLGIMLGEGSN